MTTQQDKELSSVIYEGWVAHAKRGGLLDAAGNATDSEKAQISWHSWEACHKQYATSPQLPVAEQPAGQAAIKWPALPDGFIKSVQQLVLMARTSGGTAGRDDGLCAALDAVECRLEAVLDPEWQAGAGQREQYIKELEATVDAHSPVAQMSGDESHVLHVLRNPFGFDAAEIRSARLRGADLIERYRNAYANILEFAEANGLDTTARNQ